MIGESVEGTIINFYDYSGKPFEKGKHGTFSSYTVKVSGNHFTAQNIRFENGSGKLGQALALYVDADQAMFINAVEQKGSPTIQLEKYLCRATNRSFFYRVDF